MSSLSIAFFGTGPLAESVLATLVSSGYVPKLVITKKDTPQGRHMIIQSPHIKSWCDIKNIPVYQPETLKEIASDSPLLTQPFDLFIVASYGKIIPEATLALPKKGTLNVHPSLLPLYRGPSPIESALLAGETEIGVTIMLLDKEVDHGPILTQSAFILDKKDTAGQVEVRAGMLGGELLVQSIPHFIEGALIPKEQKHSLATFCKKIDKSLGEIHVDDDASSLRNKYKALTPWPGIYFFIDHTTKKKDDKNEDRETKKLRIKINSINVEDESIQKAIDCIETVTPEGKHTIPWDDFVRGYM